jgi:hypothetical protein
MHEGDILADLRLEVQKLNCTTFRNNTGRFKIHDNYGKPRWVQFGLCVGSADTIGWTEHVITEADVGRRVAIFTAFETKTPKGKKPTDAQLNFIGHVLLAGGIAAVCRSASDAIQAINEWRARGSRG